MRRRFFFAGFLGFLIAGCASEAANIGASHDSVDIADSGDSPDDAGSWDGNGSRRDASRDDASARDASASDARARDGDVDPDASGFVDAQWPSCTPLARPSTVTISSSSFVFGVELAVHHRPLPSCDGIATFTRSDSLSSNAAGLRFGSTTAAAALPQGTHGIAKYDGSLSLDAVGSAAQFFGIPPHAEVSDIARDIDGTYFALLRIARKATSTVVGSGPKALTIGACTSGACPALSAVARFSSAGAFEWAARVVDGESGAIGVGATGVRVIARVTPSDALGPSNAAIPGLGTNEVGYVFADFDLSGTYRGATLVEANVVTPHYAWPRLRRFVHHEDGSSTVILNWYQVVADAPNPVPPNMTFDAGQASCSHDACTAHHGPTRAFGFLAPIDGGWDAVRLSDGTLVVHGAAPVASNLGAVAPAPAKGDATAYLVRYSSSGSVSAARRPGIMGRLARGNNGSYWLFSHSHDDVHVNASATSAPVITAPSTGAVAFLIHLDASGALLHALEVAKAGSNGLQSPKAFDIARDPRGAVVITGAFGPAATGTFGGAPAPTPLVGTGLLFTARVDEP